MEARLVWVTCKRSATTLWPSMNSSRNANAWRYCLAGPFTHKTTGVIDHSCQRENFIILLHTLPTVQRIGYLSLPNLALEGRIMCGPCEDFKRKGMQAATALRRKRFLNALTPEERRKVLKEWAPKRPTRKNYLILRPCGLGF